VRLQAGAMAGSWQRLAVKGAQRPEIPRDRLCCDAVPHAGNAGFKEHDPQSPGGGRSCEQVLIIFIESRLFPKFPPDYPLSGPDRSQECFPPHASCCCARAVLCSRAQVSMLVR
jgi:hypothetical protein